MEKDIDQSGVKVERLTYYMICIGKLPILGGFFCNFLILFCNRFVTTLSAAGAIM